MMRKLYLFKISVYFCFLCELLEVIAFSVWWIGKTCFAYTINSLGIFRSPFVLLYIPIAMLAIGTLSIFFYYNFRQYKKYVIFGFLIIFVNFPILFILRCLQREIDPRAYIKIYNYSKFDISELAIKEPDNQKYIGNLKKNQSIITFYNPDYKELNSVSGLSGIYDNFLIVKYENNKIAVRIPIIHPGSTHKLKITENFTLTEILP